MKLNLVHHCGKVHDCLERRRGRRTVALVVVHIDYPAIRPDGDILSVGRHVERATRDGTVVSKHVNAPLPVSGIPHIYFAVAARSVHLAVRTERDGSGRSIHLDRPNHLLGGWRHQYHLAVQPSESELRPVARGEHEFKRLLTATLQLMHLSNRTRLEFVAVEEFATTREDNLATPAEEDPRVDRKVRQEDALRHRVIHTVHREDPQRLVEPPREEHRGIGMELCNLHRGLTRPSHVGVLDLSGVHRRLGERAAV
mmetsp:Transcript_15320/g.39424  ORF Transcript_15320/g.39424 Transcript_15320/m.39424 type:complete len:255 (+) Transcript_15320:1889-2653(+)